MELSFQFSFRDALRRASASHDRLDPGLHSDPPEIQHVAVGRVLVAPSPSARFRYSIESECVEHLLVCGDWRNDEVDGLTGERAESSTEKCCPRGNGFRLSVCQVQNV